MSKILLIGIATLDIINVVNHYPEEDEEMRVTTQYVSAGGNACNSARMLSKLGHKSALAAVVADESDGRRIVTCLEAVGVETAFLQWQAGKSPVSYITLNQLNGSRTIVHYRDLPELKAAHLIEQIPVHEFDWLHVEGRNIQASLAMLSYANEVCTDQVISLEIEKHREDGAVEALIPLANVVMFSKAYVQTMGTDEPATFLAKKHVEYPDHIFTCAWGERGAYAIARDGVVHFEAAPSVTVVDSVGAGDVFNAGIINALSSNKTIDEALEEAVVLASTKVQKQGV